MPREGPGSGDVLTEPQITFSKWVRWRDRGALVSGGPCMGVYVWAHFRESPPSDNRPFPDLPEELIYIGETNDLNTRPLTGRHQRLKHYVDQFRDRNYEHLYLSVRDIGRFQRSAPKCHALRAFTKYIEARLGWEYTRQFGSRPRLDHKEGKDELYVPRLRMAVGRQPYPAVQRPGARVARSGR
jgi:hypothetical protein